MNVKRLTTKIIIKIANVLFRFSNWVEFKLDFYEISRGFGKKILSIGRTIYPKSFCPHCGVPVEKCYYGIKADGTKNEPPFKYHCCNCEHPLSDEYA